MKELFKKMIGNIQHKHKQDDYIKITIASPDLSLPINIVPARLEDFDIDNVFNHIEFVLNSNEDVMVDDNLQVGVGIISNILQIKGKKYNKDVQMDRVLQNSKCIVQIKNNDHKCGYKAIVVGFAKLMKRKETNLNHGTMSTFEQLFVNRFCTTKFYKNLTSRNSTQTRLVDNMRQQLLPQHNFEETLRIVDIPKFEEVLKLSIQVVQQKFGNAKFIYTSRKYDESLYLYLHNDHYDVITTITGFFKTPYFCELCMTPYKNKEEHCCENQCYICNDYCQGDKEPLKCPDCFAPCKNAKC